MVESNSQWSDGGFGKQRDLLFVQFSRIYLLIEIDASHPATEFGPFFESQSTDIIYDPLEKARGQNVIIHENQILLGPVYILDSFDLTLDRQVVTKTGLNLVHCAKLAPVWSTA